MFPDGCGAKGQEDELKRQFEGDGRLDSYRGDYQMIHGEHEQAQAGSSH